MSTIRIYDRALCCSTGVCGPQIDPALLQFAADLEWLKAAGHIVERYNLAQQPDAFLQNAAIQQMIAAQGVDVLPVTEVDGQIVGRGSYPDRAQFAAWTGAAPAAAVLLPLAGFGALPVLSVSGTTQGGGDTCCLGSNCCQADPS